MKPSASSNDFATDLMLDNHDLTQKFLLRIKSIEIVIYAIKYGAEKHISTLS